MRGLSIILKAAIIVFTVNIPLMASSKLNKETYLNNPSQTKAFLSEDSLIIKSIDNGDTIAAAQIEWVGDEWVRLYSDALITRFSEGMIVENDTCYLDSCEIMFDFPNLNCSVIASLYYLISCEDSIHTTLLSEDNALSGFGYLKKTACLSKVNNTVSFTVPRKTCHFLITLEGLGIKPSCISGQYWGLLQNPCYYLLMTPLDLEPVKHFSTDGLNKRFTYPNVDRSLFTMWFFQGDYARINRDCIKWKDWEWWNIEDEDD